MRSTLSALLVVGIIHGTAHAQPGQTPPADPEPDPPPTQTYPAPPNQPYPAPNYYVPPPQQYSPIQLTAEEQALLSSGEISDNQYYGGAIASLFFGLGIGQAVQGRWVDTGWIFTVGEVASMTALIVGIGRSLGACGFPDETCNTHAGESLMIGGLVGLAVFRIWEVVDAFSAPPKHNQRVRALKLRLGIQPSYAKTITPYVNKTHDGGGTAGLTFRF